MTTAELQLPTTSGAIPAPGTTMKALVYHGPGKRAWEDKPRPTLQDPLPSAAALCTLIRVPAFMHADGLPCVSVPLNLLQPGLMESRATVVIPFDDRVLFVSSLNCAEFPIRRSEVAQALDAISGTQLRAGG